jgi:E3 ubiquitin-protein ligase HUWE1
MPRLARSARLLVPQHPDIEAVITRINACPTPSLATLIKSEVPPNTPWRYPRGDLHSWIPVLDRFDGILGDLLETYTIDRSDGTTVQGRRFDEQDKELVLEILRFERILLDNSTSRKIYASYDRLQALLFTQDLQVLHATILLILRPSQQYGSHTPFELSNNKVVRGRLLKIVMSGGGWGKLKELGYDMVKLAKMSEREEEEPLMDNDHDLDLPIAFYDLSTQFYRPSSDTPGFPTTVEPGTATPVSTELERPTQELRIQPSALGRSVVGADDEGIEATTYDTPSRPSASVVRRGESNIVDTPMTPFTPFVSRPAPPVIEGSSSVTSFSRAYTNSDGLTVVYVPATEVVPLVKDGSKDAMGVLGVLVESHAELRGIAEVEEKEEKEEKKEEEKKEEGSTVAPSVAASTASKKTPNKYAALNDAMREEQFELLCRLRIMLMMDVRDGKMSPRVKQDVTCMLEIRLAALATYLYLTSEDKAQTELFLYEPNMVAQLAELVNPNSKVSDRIVAPAFMALDACAHYRYKCTEVVAALNANVAHGTLMNCYREIIKRLGTEQGAPHELVDSVLSFVAFLAASSGYGNMLVGAGIIPLIIDLIKVEHPARGGYVARAMGLIDNMMYTSNNAFNIFCNANGLQTLNHRITVEVDRLISGEFAQSIATESDLLRRTTPLKLMLRSVHRLMQASGTVDALRNLIDSELPKSLLKIFNNVDKMGASVFALAIHVTAAFVHNEPTSLSILQEMKLPDALYDALERNRQASFEILSAVPNAVGAFCLNATGMDLTVQRREVLGRLVNNCADPAYRDILRERDNASFLGTSLDELARHHPPLKPILLDALATLLKDLVTQGETAAVFNQWEPSKYRLMTVEDEQKQKTENKDEPEAETSAPMEAEDAPVRPQIDAHGRTSYTFNSTDYKSTKKDDNQIEVTIDIVAQLMQGLFHNTQLGKDFLAQDGLKLVLDIYGSPSLRNSFATSGTAERLHIVLRSLAEASLSKVLNGIIERVRTVMDSCRGLWDSEMQTSYLSPLISALGESFRPPSVPY